MNIEIVEIEARQTYPLRHALLRKGMPLSSCHLEGDKAVETLHIGAFESETLIGILSAYSNPCPQHPNLKGVQLRAMAVATGYQRKGIASQLIQSIFKRIEENLHPDCIWLNARIAANALYESNGFVPIGPTFEIESIGTHQRYLKLLSYES
jgi:ribosomal protein S18 acetylase RimI-like enzyme